MARRHQPRRRRVRGASLREVADSASPSAAASAARSQPAPSPALVPAPPGRGRRWIWIGLGVAVLLLVVGAGGAAAYNVFKDWRDFTKRLRASLAPFGLSEATNQIIIAQAAHESGWGKAPAAKVGFNYWNITAGSAWKGPVTDSGDPECDSEGKNCKPIKQKFRKYRNDREAITDFLSFLSTQNGGRYRTAYAALLAGDATAYATELRKAGYYTASVDSYVAGTNALVRMIQSVA